MKIDLQSANDSLQQSRAEQIVEWALQRSDRPILTTNFRPYEAVILHLVTQVMPDIPILWVDSGYNTSATYRFAQGLIERLGLNIKTYIPLMSSARRNVLMGGIPSVDDPQHELFTHQVKLEPFRRALSELQPDLWFNAIRKDQTEFRQSLNVVSQSQEGILKVAPLFYWSEADLDAYLERYALPNELDYFDPTKALETRECGLHTQL